LGSTYTRYQPVNAHHSLRCHVIGCLPLLVSSLLVLCHQGKIDCISTSPQPCLIAHLTPDHHYILSFTPIFSIPIPYPHTPLGASVRSCPSPLVLPRCRAQRFQSRAVVHLYTSLSVSHEDGDAILECRTLSRFLFVLVLSLVPCPVLTSTLLLISRYSFLPFLSYFIFLVLRFLSFFEPQLD
jgi:hypothetical protein